MEGPQSIDKRLFLIMLQALADHVSGRREAEGKAVEAELRRLGAEAAFIQADAAFGPDRGETLGKMCDTYPAKLVNDKYLTPDAAGFLCIDRSKFSAAA